MSQIYSTEPVTEGKVLLHTSLGDIDIELWSKQAPKTCRNFLTLCLSGSLDDTLFDRILKDFLVQHQGNPDEETRHSSSENLKPEYHPRIRFNHRGQVAMVKGSKSKFFITLDTADHLYQKCTIFGKVTGPTMFNVLRMGNIATNEKDCPDHPIKLKSIEVLSNPFDDLNVLRQKRKSQLEEEAEAAAAKLKVTARKSTRNSGLLSFGPGDDDSSDSDNDITGHNIAGRKLKHSTPVLAISVKSSHDIEDKRPKKKRKKDKKRKTEHKDKKEMDANTTTSRKKLNINTVSIVSEDPKDTTTSSLSVPGIGAVDSKSTSSSCHQQPNLVERLGRFKKMNTLDLEEEDDMDDY